MALNVEEAASGLKRSLPCLCDRVRQARVPPQRCSKLSKAEACVLQGNNDVFLTTRAVADRENASVCLHTPCDDVIMHTCGGECSAMWGAERAPLFHSREGCKVDLLPARTLRTARAACNRRLSQAPFSHSASLKRCRAERVCELKTKSFLHCSLFLTRCTSTRDQKRNTSS